MKTNLIQTIKNLDSVLGVTPLPPFHQQPIVVRQATVAKQPAKAVKLPKKQEIPKLDYFKFAEVVNGRCATLGLLLGRINYIQTGHDMYTQVTTYPLENFMLMLGNAMIISTISLYTFEKRDDKNIAEEFEQITGNFFMINWLINLSLLSVNFLYYAK